MSIRTDEGKKRLTVSMSPKVVRDAKRRAAQENRNFSNYLETLIIEDVSRTTDEAPVKS